jgi:hypothetical protein
MRFQVTRIPQIMAGLTGPTAIGLRPHMHTNQVLPRLANVVRDAVGDLWTERTRRIEEVRRAPLIPQGGRHCTLGVAALSTRGRCPRVSS